MVIDAELRARLQFGPSHGEPPEVTQSRNEEIKELRVELLTLNELLPGRRGKAVARRLIKLGNPLAESPLESLGRAVIIRAGLPIPELQVEIRGSDGRLYRMDGAYRNQRVAIEFDGRIKYFGDLGDPDMVAYQEHLRQTAIGNRGWRVVRTSWNELIHHPEAFINALRNALEEQNRRVA
ncbi:hypothetical protein [Neoactinobaculum massilliense]|uniref:hypothetical protein n=1 Tax=Neoactinobaculum massilliense TaxID=2364794 RepID=UPI001F14DE3D|nr:hypothetical protein [Neoactinobaculum massilliense]